MKYTLYDLILNNQTPFSSREALIAYLHRNFFAPYSRRSLDSFLVNVNVTGKDLVAAYDYFNEQWTLGLRRWLVTDEKGRHIDVRAWADEIKNYKPSYKKNPLSEFRYDPANSGSKQHDRLIKGPSFYHQSLKALDTDQVDEALEYAEPKAIHFGNPNKLDFWDHEFYFDRNRGSKSWKDQKCRYQWQKHCKKKRCRRQSKVDQVLNHWQSEEISLDDMFDQTLFESEETFSQDEFKLSA